MSPLFAINVGVHQGSALSPLLFVLCMDTVTSDLQSPHPWSLLYADDVFLANGQHQDLLEQTRQWNERLGEFGLWLNIKKTEYMECDPQTDETISIGGEELKKVEQFKYLGSLICSSGDSFPDARAHVNAAWMKWRQESRQSRRKCGKEDVDGMGTLFAVTNTQWRGQPCVSTLMVADPMVDPRNDGWIE
uniref:Reverse transcriptase domain-containing protein n=1 Tax=Plectus sambesii TaxID=2011161 RepID=A0A914VVP6_9BILA